MSNFPFLTVITFLPLLGAAVIALLPNPRSKTVKQVALGFTLVAFVLSLIMFAGFDLGQQGIQFAERYQWIPQLNIHYYLGVDGLSLPLVILTTLLGMLAVLVSWRIELRPKEYFAWFLVLETGVLGVFSSLDFVLFFLFWEVELVPMFMLISVWGTGRKEYSAIKFVIYTILGSAFMLVGILALYFSTGTFDIIELGRMDLRAAVLPLPVLFFLLFFGFAIKLPVFPFHTWLPDAHTDAPTAVSVILAGVLLKMGGYAIIRIVITILPGMAQEYAPYLALFAVINVLYGAAVTLVQKDLKRMIAYSSVSHMGYVLLGVAALNQVGLTGAALQMFTHGTITGLLFALVGLTYDKTHNRQIPELGGLAQRMPLIAVIFTIASLASLGLPGMSGFVAELLVFVGGYTSTQFPAIQLYTFLGIFGIVLTAGYMLWMMQRAFFGQLNPKYEHVGDASALEAVPLFALVAVIVLVGIYPSILTDVIGNGILPVLARLG